MLVVGPDAAAADVAVVGDGVPEGSALEEDRVGTPAWVRPVFVTCGLAAAGAEARPAAACGADGVRTSRSRTASVRAVISRSAGERT